MIIPTPDATAPFFDVADPAFSVTSAEVRRAREAGWYARTSYGLAAPNLLHRRPAGPVSPRLTVVTPRVTRDAAATSAGSWPAAGPAAATWACRTGTRSSSGPAGAAGSGSRARPTGPRSV